MNTIKWPKIPARNRTWPTSAFLITQPHLFKATNDINSAEHRELYLYLVGCFIEGDQDMDGCVNAIEFDNMIEKAAVAPRKIGLAPRTDQIFKTPEDRFKARKAMFEKMDLNSKQKLRFKYV